MPIEIAQLLTDLRIAQRSAWELGERILVESYLQRYSELANHEESVLDFIYCEYCLREELGDRPSPDEYTTRFPQWAASLQRLLDLHQAMGMANTSSTTNHSDQNASTNDSPSSLVLTENTGRETSFGQSR